MEARDWDSAVSEFKDDFHGFASVPASRMSASMNCATPSLPQRSPLARAADDRQASRPHVGPDNGALCSPRSGTDQECCGRSLKKFTAGFGLID